MQPGLSSNNSLNRRRLRIQTVSAVNTKPFHTRPERIRHNFEDEFAHFFSGADLGLAKISTAATPNMLTDRKPTRVGGDA